MNKPLSLTSIHRYWAAIVGNIAEHYDQALYGFLVPFLAPLFFPHTDSIYSLLAGYALLPLGFLSKPLGAFIFGRLGDRKGNGGSLSATLFGMAIATAGMGCLPTFEQVGWLAPFLLAFGRILQNFFAGGENTGGALFLLEKIQREKRGFMSSLFDASGISGILLAALAATFCGAEHWRWLFWIGGLSGIFGFFIRKEMLKNIPKRKTQWKWDWRDWKIIAVIAIVSGFSYTNYYLLSSFLNGFLPLVSRVTTQEALALNSFLLIVDLLLLPFFGWLSLKVEKERLMLGATIAGACLALPLFLMLEGANAWIAGSIRIAFTVIGVCLAAPYHAWAMEMAPQERRFTVCAIGSALGGRLIGAPMPALGLWLYHKTGWAASPALPLLVISLLATAAIAFLKVTRFSSEELAKS